MTSVNSAKDFLSRQTDISAREIKAFLTYRVPKSYLISDLPAIIAFLIEVILEIVLPSAEAFTKVLKDTYLFATAVLVSSDRSSLVLHSLINSAASSRSLILYQILYSGL